MSPTMHRPMAVEAIKTAPGEYTMDPPLDPSWSDLMKLQWLTGSIKARLKFDIIIITGEMKEASPNPLLGMVDRPDVYGLSFRGASIGPLEGFNTTWTAISFLGLGYDQGRRDTYLRNRKNH